MKQDLQRLFTITGYCICRRTPGVSYHLYWTGKKNKVLWSTNKCNSRWYSSEVNARIAARVLKKFGHILETDEITFEK